MISLRRIIIFGCISLHAKINVSNASVGVFSKGYNVNGYSNLNGDINLLTEGCYVGRARNLVVEPKFQVDLIGGEVLDTSSGTEVCSWLKQQKTIHDSLLDTWNIKQLEKRSKVNRINIYRRIREYLRNSPRFNIKVNVDYLDLWNLDNFGNPLPWISATLTYDCPDEDSGNGVYNELCGKTFSYSTNNSRVFFLLQPQKMFNRPYEPKSSYGSYLTGAVSGMLRPTKAQNHIGLNGNATILFGSLMSKIVIDGKISEFWNNGFNCYFRNLLSVDWNFGTGDHSVCNALRTENSAYSILKANILSSVRLYIIGFDLFNQYKPAMQAMLSEGILTGNYGQNYLVVRIDTNPDNEPSYRASTKARNVVSGMGLISKLFGTGVPLVPLVPLVPGKTSKNETTQSLYPKLPVSEEYIKPLPYNPNFIPETPPPSVPSAPPLVDIPNLPSGPPHYGWNV